MGTEEVKNKMVGILSTRIASGFKDLLEKKHLYQSIEIKLEDLQEHAKELPSNLRHHIPGVWNSFKEVASNEWLIEDPAFVAPVSTGIYAQIRTKELDFEAPTVKLYCVTCEGREAFNPVSCSDYLSRGKILREKYVEKGRVVQVFTLSYLCQACKKIPEVFIIRRTGMKLALSGRAPMEFLEIPSHIPKEVREYFSGAKLAFNSGQTLPALFMLRTLIEQWAVTTNTNKSLRADKAMSAYMSSLPPDFKKRFPSIKALYGELSADIHQAVGSQELFEKALGQISQHFDARRLYNIVAKAA